MFHRNNMYTEFEATFPNIDRAALRKRLVRAGAKLQKGNYLMKRFTFNLPSGHEVPGAWLRVRDEGDRTTLSLKIINGQNIEDQKEICLAVDNFASAVELLEVIGARLKSYQENYREIWLLDDVEVCLDEWPYLEPFAEVEGLSEAAVKNASSKLGLDYQQARFCAVTSLYQEKYALSEDRINNHTARITFSDPNPFI